MITAQDLDFEQTSQTMERTELRVARERADRSAIAAAIALNDGNLSAAARDLNISRPMLYDLLNTYGMAKN
jgi:two-component system NtrC family response regulator